MTLAFSKANSKLKKLYDVPALQNWLGGRKVYSFDLLSGWSCPFANECHSKVVEVGGKRKVKDGPNTRFRCFSASQEALYTNVYNHRKSNDDQVKKMNRSEVVQSICEVMPDDLGICRIHVSGDMFNEGYFRAWCDIARENRDRLFYAYTKSLQYWVTYRRWIPENLVLTASRGGRDDDLINRHRLREAVVVFSEQEAADLSYEIDYDDSHAADPAKSEQSFSLMLHGVQPPKSLASKALQLLRKRK